MTEKNKLTKEDRIYKKYTRHSIDDSIVNFLQSRDKWNFGNQDKVFFFKEMSYMLKWWVGIMEAVETIRHSTDNYAVKEITRGINKFLHRWKTLSHALNRLPDYFDEWDYNVVKAGEKSWNMVIVLESLAQEYEYMNDIKNKYIWALIYPVILVVIAVTAVFALFWFVLPNIFDIADSFTGMDLPTTTRVLRNISDFVSVNRKLLVYSAGGIGLLWWLFLSTDTGKRSWFNTILAIPLIWRMTRYYYLVRRCRYMKLMLVSGMNYVETFKTLRDVLSIPLYQDMIERILAWLQRWDTIYDALKHENFLIPSNVSVLIKVWEETANLENAVGNVLDMYQEELNVTIARLAKVIEPIMLVFIGLIVVVIASWVFGLILQIMEGAWM